MHYLDKICGIKIDSMEEYIDTLTKLFNIEIYWNQSENRLREDYFNAHLNSSFRNKENFYLVFIYNESKKKRLSLTFTDYTRNINIPAPKKLFNIEKLDKAIAYAKMKTTPNEKVTEF